MIITQFGGAAFQTTALDGTRWAICLGLGFVSLPIGVIIRLIPDDFFFFLFRNPETRALYLHPSQPVIPSVYVAGSERMAWNSAYSTVRRQLDVFRSLRGGRLRASEQKQSGALAAATMVPSLVATLGAGWVPQAIEENNGEAKQIQMQVDSEVDLSTPREDLLSSSPQASWDSKLNSVNAKGVLEKVKAAEEARPSFEMEES